MFLNQYQKNKIDMFAVFLLLLGLIINYVVSYDTKITILVSGYEITTTTNFLIISFIIIIFALYFILLILYPYKSKKSEGRVYKKFNKYLNLITEAIFYKDIDSINISRQKLKLANKLFGDTNLYKLLEAKIDGNKRIDIPIIDADLLNLKMDFIKAKNNCDVEVLKNLSLSILKIKPNDKESLLALLQVYKDEKNWDGMHNILNTISKEKILTQREMEGDFVLAFSGIAENYFNQGDFLYAKKYLRKAYKLDKTHLPSSILLIKTYITLNQSAKATKIIRDVWRHTTCQELVKLYFSINEKTLNNITSLYKLNPKSFDSNFIMAKMYFERELFNKAREYSKNAEKFGATKPLYELMLQIEQSDGGSTALVNNLREKIAKMS